MHLPCQILKYVCYNYCLYQISLIVVGVLSTTTQEATGFFRSEYQPADDPRPYLQSALFASMPGNHDHVYKMMANNYNLNEKVIIHKLAIRDSPHKLRKN